MGKFTFETFGATITTPIGSLSLGAQPDNSADEEALAAAQAEAEAAKSAEAETSKTVLYAGGALVALLVVGGIVIALKK